MKGPSPMQARVLVVLRRAQQAARVGQGATVQEVWLAWQVPMATDHGLGRHVTDERDGYRPAESTLRDHLRALAAKGLVRSRKRPGTNATEWWAVGG